MRALIVGLILLASPGLSQTARVTSGEHDGFSRLVVELPAPTDWRFGRQSDGYALATIGPVKDYDLDGIFDLIGRTRLAAVTVDPQTRNLQIGLACACHAIPFEFRPGVIVIDIREGAPPEGSSFEDPLPLDITRASPGRPKPRPVSLTGLSTNSAGDTARHAAPEPPTGPVPEAGTMTPSRWVLSEPVDPTDGTASVGTREPSGTYDWLALGPRRGNAPPQPTGVPFDLPMPSPELGHLQADLLLQISRGAARGVVDLAEPGPPPPMSQTIPEPGPTAQVAIDPSAMGPANMVIGQEAQALTAAGEQCIADADLDIANWGRPGPVATELASVTSGLVGEFDKVNPEALFQAVRYYLYLGFGAEAEHLLRSFPVTTPDPGTAQLVSLSRLIDGSTDPTGPFAAMMPCETTAAFWAVLSRDRLTPTDNIDTQAVLRGFSALPIALRRDLGPDLAARFLAIDRPEIVRAIRDSIQRAPEGTGAELTLIDANMELATGDPETAANLSGDVIRNAGPSVPKAMITLVDATLAQGKPVDAETTNALSALLREEQGAALEAPLARALILGLASSGDAETAFAMLHDHPDVKADLWAVLAGLGAESDLLEQAVGQPDAPQDGLSDSTRFQVAERLVDLGFVAPALTWLGQPQANWDDEHRLLAARANRALGHTDTASDLLAGMTAPAAQELQAALFLQKGDAASAATLFAELGDKASQDHAAIVGQDWAVVSDGVADPWKTAAARIEPAATIAAPSEPLAHAQSLLDDAATTRKAMTELLASVALPPESVAPDASSSPNP
jgi:hypothetical protein